MEARMGIIPAFVIEACRTKLLETKMEIMNRVRENQQNLRVYEGTTGDEADQSVRVTEEADAVATQERLRNTLAEISFALARIENGTYGICEETEELIEKDRLLAIPWTRLSIEGAEVRESVQRRFAR
jgi:DnaK suppressor protein